MEKRKYLILAILGGFLALIWIINLLPGEKEEDVVKSTKGARPRRPAISQKVKGEGLPVKVLAGPIQLEKETKDLFRPLYPRATAQAPGSTGTSGKVAPPPAKDILARPPGPPGAGVTRPGPIPGQPIAPPKPGEMRPPPPGSPPGPPGMAGVPEAGDLKGLAFLGLVRTGARQTLFFSKDQEVLTVRKGDILFDKYKVEKVTEESVLLISPKREEITITFVEGEPLKVTMKTPG